MYILILLRARHPFPLNSFLFIIIIYVLLGMDQQRVNQARIEENTAASELVRGLGYFHPITPGVAQFLQEYTIPVTARKKELLLKAGTICKYIYFIRKGTLRGFIKQGHKDVTTWITAENELVTAIPSLNKECPAREYIQAIEDCELIALSYEDLELLYKEHPEFNITIRKLLQKYYEDAEGRAFVVRLTKAEDKYNYFLDKYQHLAHRIPLKYVASFLGMTQETLSRVRKKAMKTKKVKKVF